MFRIDTEEELEYKYGDFDQERVVAPGDKESVVYVAYGQPLTNFSQFLNISQDRNWISNWPRN